MQHFVVTKCYPRVININSFVIQICDYEAIIAPRIDGPIDEPMDGQTKPSKCGLLNSPYVCMSASVHTSSRARYNSPDDEKRPENIEQHRNNIAISPSRIESDLYTRDVFFLSRKTFVVVVIVSHFRPSSPWVL